LSRTPSPDCPEVQKPKARDPGATAGARIRFTSNILPKWARRTKSLDALLPVLYLRGISAGDFQEALAAEHREHR
jgi:putative transposase